MKPSIPKRIAWLGTGLMGAPMAGRLADAGFSVTAWNRTPEKAAPLQERGVHLADSPRAAVAEAEVVITMLTNACAVEDAILASGAINDVLPQSLVVDMSTTSPEDARRHAQMLTMCGIAYLDAPVSGGTRGAQNGTLSIMAGGVSEAFATALPVFEVLGRATHIGPTGTGQLSKLSNQVIVAATIGAVGEALLLAQRGGANPRAVREALLGGFADSRVLTEHGLRMLDRDFAPGGTATNQIKDLDTASSVAADCGLRLPLLQTVRELFTALRDAGDGELDHSALLVQLERMNPDGEADS
jgi:2-hydroxy-3-oxopropionate reductase